MGTSTGSRVGIETVRRHLHQADYVCKRATWTLRRKAAEQPERVEAVLATAALPSPSPTPVAPRRCLTDLPSLPTGADDPDLAALLALLPQADVYLQDEVQIALHPARTDRPRARRAP